MDAWTPQCRDPLRHPPGQSGRMACSRRPDHLFTMPIQVFTMPIWLFTMERSERPRWSDPAVNDEPIRVFTMVRNPHQALLLERLGLELPHRLRIPLRISEM